MVARTQLIGCIPATRLGQVGDTCSPSGRRVSNNLPYIRDRRYFTVIATVKKNSSTTIDKASNNHQTIDTGKKRVRIQTFASQIMVLQLTDFTLEIIDEELREFISEYYITVRSCPLERAGCGCEYSGFPSGEDDALVPWNFTFYTQGLLPRDERPPPGSYSMEDAELINENHIPINAYSEAFLCHMGISHNYFQRPEEVPTFIGDDGREMDLFSVVHLSKPKQVIEGVRPLRDGEEPLLESTAGRIMELVLEQPEIESTDVLAPTPLRSVPSITWRSGDDGAGPSKRVRHLSLGLSTSTEEETPDASPTLAAKEVTETPPPKCCTSPPQIGHRLSRYAVDQAYGGAQKVADAQAEAESSRSYAQHLAEEKMALLVKVEQERADAAEYKASCHWAVKYLEGGKNNHFAGLDDFRHKVEGLLEKQEDKLRKLSIEYDEELYPHMLSTVAERRWLISHGLRLAAMSTLESQEVRQSFGDVVKCALARGKAEAVEELHERRLLTVPAAQVPGYNQKAYEELVAAMEAMKLLELPHIAQLERDQDYPIGVIMTGLTLARHATEGAEAQPDYFLKPDVSQLQVPIFASPRDILNPFALEKEVPLKESLEAHAIRLAKKKGVKGKAILCGVGAAHLPRSDGVPVSVATVSPKDSELLGKLEEAGDAAYQVGRPEQSRCHSI
ncbi:hypothetical protein Tco_1184537 [Tanacetum coccineum]